MKLIVGLGNPGKEYEKTRHNVGFMVLDAIASELGGQFCELSRWNASTLELQVNGEKVILMKPLTFMNRSGEAVAKFAHYYHIEPKDIWVVSDDLDLPIGRIRVRDEGGSGGHNGLKSIIEVLGTEAFGRIRLGISEFEGDMKSTDAIRREPEASIFVLQSFSKREQELAEQAVEQAARLIIESLNKRELTGHTMEISPGITVV